MKFFESKSSSGLGLPVDTFIYSAIVVQSFWKEQKACQFVVASSDNSLTWIEIHRDRDISAIRVLGREAMAHNLGITCLQPFDAITVPHSNAPDLVSAGRDGLLKLWRTGTTGPVLVLSTR